MHFQKLKVRPRKSLCLIPLSRLTIQLFLGRGQNICGTELAAMLSCWAATNDLHATGRCMETVQDLYRCMQTTVSLLKHHIAFHPCADSMTPGNSREATKI